MRAGAVRHRRHLVPPPGPAGDADRRAAAAARASCASRATSISCCSAAVIATILIASQWKPGIAFDIYGTKVAAPGAAARRHADGDRDRCRSLLTPNEHRESNGFTWEPIREVAILFAGIFACIIPVLAMLQAGKAGAFGWLPAPDRRQRRAQRDRLFLAHRPAVGVPRQRADLSRVLRAGRRRRTSADGPARADARRDLDGRGLHGRADLYRQRAQPHDLRDRGGARRQDAELRRLPVLGVADPAAGPVADHFRFSSRLSGGLCATPRLAPRDAALALAAFAGSATTTSTSSRAPSRAKLAPPSVVEAGSAAALR